MGNSLEKEAKYEWDSGISYFKEQPVRFSLQKSLWRDIHTFLPSPLNNKDFLCPRVVNWNAKLYREGLISSNNLILQVIGMTVDKKNVAEPKFWCSERLSIPNIYLQQNKLWQKLKDVVEIAEKYKIVFGWGSDKPYGVLAEFLKNHKAEKLAASLDGESRYWATLDRKFTEFLEALPKDSKEDANGIIHYGATELPKWTATVQKAAEDAFTESIQSIRNYEARAKALQSLNYQLRKLRGDIPEKSGKAKKSKKAD